MKRFLLALMMSAGAHVGYAYTIIFPNEDCPNGVRASVHETVDSLNWYGPLVSYCHDDQGCGNGFVLFRLEPSVNDFGAVDGEFEQFVVPPGQLDVADLDLTSCTAHFTWTSRAQPGDTIYRDGFGINF